MLKNHWYPILASAKVKSKRPIGIKCLAKKLVLWRDQSGKVVCMPDKCCHRSAQLSRGRIINDCLECPYHGLLFNQQGCVTQIPANGRDSPVPKTFCLTPYVIQEAHRLIWFWHGQVQETYPDIPWFAAHPTDHGVKLIRTNIIPINHLRILENVVDAHHLAFVHRTVGFGKLSYIDHYEASQQGEQIIADIRLSPDPSDKAYEKSKFDFHSTLLFPCMAAINFTKKLSVIAVATPVDEHHTWVYTCYRQNHLTLPGLGKLFTWLAYKFDWDLLQRYQDLPIWQSQQLEDPADISEYHLFKADKAIALFFREYQKRLANGG